MRIVFFLAFLGAVAAATGLFMFLSYPSITAEGLILKLLSPVQDHIKVGFGEVQYDYFEEDLVIDQFVIQTTTEEPSVLRVGRISADAVNSDVVPSLDDTTPDLKGTPRPIARSIVFEDVELTTTAGTELTVDRIVFLSPAVRPFKLAPEGLSGFQSDPASMGLAQGLGVVGYGETPDIMDVRTTAFLSGLQAAEVAFSGVRVSAYGGAEIAAMDSILIEELTDETTMMRVLVDALTYENTQSGETARITRIAGTRVSLAPTLRSVLDNATGRGSYPLQVPRPGVSLELSDVAVLLHRNGSEETAQSIRLTRPADLMPRQDQLTLEVAGLVMMVDQISDLEARHFFQDLGYQQLDLMVTATLTGRSSQAEVAVEPEDNADGTAPTRTVPAIDLQVSGAVTMAEVGRLQVDLDMSLQEPMVQSLEGLLLTRVRGHGVAGEIMFGSIGFGFRDQGLTRRWLDRWAVPRRQVDEAETPAIDLMTQYLQVRAEEIGPMAADVVDKLRTYLQAPNTLSVSMTPPEPMASRDLDQFLTALSQEPIATIVEFDPDLAVNGLQ